MDDSYQVKSLIKPEKFYADDDPQGIKATEALFEDLINLKQDVFEKMNNDFGEEWKSLASSRYRYLRLRYQDCFEVDFLGKKLSQFARDNFNIEL